LIVSDYTRSATEAQGQISKKDKLEPNLADVAGQLNRRFDLDVFEHRDRYGKVLLMSAKIHTFHVTLQTNSAQSIYIVHVSGRTI